MKWVLEHLQIIIAAAAAIAYFINKSRGATEERPDGNKRETSAAHESEEQAERTRRVQAEIRRKIAERRGVGSEQSQPAAARERIPPLVRPTQTPPLDPFGGPMRRIIRELEEAAEKRFEPQPDPEEAARAAVLERQQRLAAEVRALEAERLEEQKRTQEIVAMARVARANADRPALVPVVDVRSGLRNARELRRAIVLREILGAPVGLR